MAPPALGVASWPGSPAPSGGRPDGWPVTARLTGTGIAPTSTAKDLQVQW